LAGPRVAEITISMDGSRASTIYESLKPETGDESNRSNVEMKKVPEGLKIIISAQDTSALRASLNSYLRWINGIVGVQEAVLKTESGKQRY